MDRNQLWNIPGFLHPCYMISSSSWLILATVSVPLNFIDLPGWRICSDWLDIDPRWRRSSFLAWTDSKTSRERVLRRTDVPFLLSSFNWISVATSRLFCRYLGLFLASILNFLAYFTPTWNIHFIISKTYSCRSFQLFIIPIILSICPISSWSTVFQSSYLSYFQAPSAPILAPFLGLSGLSYFGKSFLALYFSDQVMSFVLCPLCFPATHILISWSCCTVF